VTTLQLSPAGSRLQLRRLVIVACLAVAALSLLIFRSPTYDPWAWLIWGREIGHGTLSTTMGPSWKPFPVFFTTVFTALGNGPAPLLWLVVARAGGLLALVLAFRLANRVAGPVAGVIAAVALLLSNQLVFFAARGDSEGLLVAIGLLAIERHVDGRRRDAFLLGVAAALIRPEAWLFLAGYGLWYIHAEWRGAARGRTLALVLGSGAAVLALWFVPEYIGSGNFLRAASRALEPVPDSPAQSKVPFVATFTNAASALSQPVYAGGLLAVAIAGWAWWRRRVRDERSALVLAVAALATVYMIVVALFAVIGFTGNQRYTTLPAALVCVLGGIGFVELFALVRGWRGLAPAVAVSVVAAAISAPFVVGTLDTMGDVVHSIRVEDSYTRQLPDVIAQAGGRDAVVACGRPITGAFETQLLAWELDLRQNQVFLQSDPPAIAIARAGTGPAKDAALPERFSRGSWVVRASCAAP